MDLVREAKHSPQTGRSKLLTMPLPVTVMMMIMEKYIERERQTQGSASQAMWKGVCQAHPIYLTTYL